LRYISDVEDFYGDLTGSVEMVNIGVISVVSTKPNSWY